MLGLLCPRCGRPTPIDLATAEEVTCAACGNRGPTPEPARSRLLAARALLHSLDVRKRQVSSAQTLVYADHYARLRLSLWLVLLACAGLEAVATAATLANHGLGDWVHAIGPSVGFASCLSLGLFTLWAMRRGRGSFEDAFAADPPRSPGDDATCHVCGGGLPATGGVVSRCRYCQADNLVAPDVLRRAAERRAVVLDDHARAVRRRASGYGVLASLLGLSMLGVLPAWTLATHLTWNKLLGPQVEQLVVGERPARPVRYVLVTRGADSCVHESDGQGKVRGRFTRDAWAALPGAREAGTFGAERLVGERFLAYDRRAFGEVLRVYSLERAEHDEAALRETQGDVGRAPLVRLCGFVASLPRFSAPPLP